MNLKDLIDEGKKLKVGKEKRIYSIGNVEFLFKRPEKPGRRLKREYDPMKNLQIWIKDENSEFMPNHLRILLDLEFKVRMRPNYTKALMVAFDRLFYGEDPDAIFKDIKDLNFPSELPSIKYDLYLTQMFFVEQEIGYHFKSNFDPRYLYLQGWIRCLLSRDKEIDKLLWSATRNPPPVKFTCKDNKKHKKFSKNAKPLWWVQHK